MCRPEVSVSGFPVSERERLRAVLCGKAAGILMLHDYCRRRVEVHHRQRGIKHVFHVGLGGAFLSCSKFPEAAEKGVRIIKSRCLGGVGAVPKVAHFLSFYSKQIRMLS